MCAAPVAANDNDNFRFYIYAWQYPDGRTFYVGKGCKGRDREEIYGRSRVFKRIVAKIRRDGNEPRIVRWQDGLSEGDAHRLEVAYIKLFGRRCAGTGALANITDGGEGVSGLIHSAATRLKLSRATLALGMVGEKHPFYGKTHSLEARAKISAAGIGRKPSEATRQKRSAALKGNKNAAGHKRTAEQIEKHRAVLIERWRDDDLRRRASEVMRSIWSDERMRHKRLAAVRAANQDPIRNSKITATVKGLWETRHHREKVMEGAHMSGPRADNTTGFKGVTFDKQTQRWRSLIRDDGKTTSIGRFDTPEEAARAYDMAAVAAWGAGKCYLNFPEEYLD